MGRRGGGRSAYTVAYDVVQSRGAHNATKHGGVIVPGVSPMRTLAD